MTTSPRPAPVRIDDLANPVFPPDIEAMRQAVVPMAESISLTTEAIIGAARAETGLTDLGPDQTSYRERMDVLTASFRNDADLAPIGVLSQWSLLTGLVRNRLRIESLIAEHPEILDIEIARPIVICGLPRTGTTHLHNLLSADPNLRSLPYWESLEPVPTPGEGVEERRTRCAGGLDVLNRALPYFNRMHEMTTDHVHEEIQLLAIDLSTMLFESGNHLPSARDYYLAHDQTPHYRYLKRVLQVLTYLRGGDRWVLKSPQHLEQFGPLATVFPDATFVVTHRDPVSVILSMCTMLAYTSRLSCANPDPIRVGRVWSQRLTTMLDAAVRDRHLLAVAQSIDVHFDEFMRDDMAMVQRIYDLAGQPLTDRSREAMETFVDANPRGRHGTVMYDADQLGLDLDALRRENAFYVNAFTITEER
jgi:Sulfotransferase family